MTRQRLVQQMALAFAALVFFACTKEARTLAEAGFGAPVGVRMVAEKGQGAYELLFALSKEEKPDTHVQALSGVMHDALSACPKFLSEGNKGALRRVQINVKKGKITQVQATAPAAKDCVAKALKGKEITSAKTKSFNVLAELRGEMIK